MDIENTKYISIAKLDISIKSFNSLARAGIYSVGDILEKIESPDDFLAIKNLNTESAEEIYKKLESLGIDLFLPNAITDYDFNKRINLDIKDIGLSTGTIIELKNSGINSVSDLMYELITDSDYLHIGLTQLEVDDINKSLRALGLKLGIFNEPISSLGIFDSLNERLEAQYDSIQDILETGYNNIIDSLSAEDAVRVGCKLRRAGYLLPGYPGWDNPETCEKLREYILDQPITFLEISDQTVKRMNLARGTHLNLTYFYERPVSSWYTIIQDYEECLKIAKQLQKYCIPLKKADVLQLGEEIFLKENTILYTPLEEFNIPLKLYNKLKNKGIKYISQLISYSASDLKDQNIVSDSSLSSIREALYNGRLLLKYDYVLKCKNCIKSIVSDDITRTVCDDCSEKIKRTSKISKLEITISGPDYGAYTNLSSGFTLYANMKNTTSHLLKINLIDFYVVEDDKQISPKYSLSGYLFDEEVVMPSTVKSSGKIWETTRFKYSTSLSYNTYAVLVIKIDSEDRNRMYKFAYKTSTWMIDDFFMV